MLPVQGRRVIQSPSVMGVAAPAVALVAPVKAEASPDELLAPRVLVVAGAFRFLAPTGVELRTSMRLSNGPA